MLGTHTECASGEAGVPSSQGDAEALPPLPNCAPPNRLRLALTRLSRSRANGRLGLLFDATVALGLLYAGLHGHPALLGGLGVFAAGLILFTLLEYVFHRWLFHGPVAAFERGHQRHHEQPLGDDALPFFFPPLGMLALAGLLALILPASDALLFAAAVASGYALYGVSHTAIHLHRFRNPAARQWARAHHVHHHHPRANFGVTTPLWDIVFGTRYVSQRGSSPS